MTNLNLTLSNAFLTNYTSNTPNGIWMDAVVFDGKTGIWQSTTPLIANGVAQGFSATIAANFPSNTNWPATGSATTSISLPSPLPNGSIYFIVTSAPLTTTSDPIPGILTGNGTSQSENNIIPTNLLRFAQFEVTLDGAPGDAADITNVNSFGFPMQVAVFNNMNNQNTWDTRGYNETGNNLWTSLAGLDSGDTIWSWANPSGAGPILNSGNRLAVGPAWSGYPASGTVYQPSDWTTTINKLIASGASNPSSILGHIEGTSNSTTDVTFYSGTGFSLWHNEGFLNYDVKWVQTIFYNNAADSGSAVSGLPNSLSTQGYFVLSPTNPPTTEGNSGSVQGYIVISPYGNQSAQTDPWNGGLSNSIYSQLGKVMVFASDPTQQAFEAQAPLSFTDQNIPQPSTQPATWSQASSYMGEGVNNQWSTVIRNFVAGLDSGYYGGATGNSPNAAIKSSIDLSKQWNQSPYYSYGGADSGAVNNFVYSDPYANIFYANSNAYGYSYSDAVNAFFKVGPLINVGKYSTAPGGAGNVDAINIALYGDGEAAGGFVQNKVANYIAPSTSGSITTPATATSANSLQVNLAQLAAYGTSSSAPYTPQNPASAGQVSSILDLNKANISIQLWDPALNGGSGGWSTSANMNNGSSTWSDWTFSYAAGQLTATSGNSQSFNSGMLHLNALPVIKSGVTWYQITVQDKQGQHSTAFNLYVQADANGNFDASVTNPVEIDGAAVVSVDLSGNYQVNLAQTGLNITAFDPSLVSHTTPINYLFNGEQTFTTVYPTNSTPFAPIIGTIGNAYYSPISDAPLDANGNNETFSAISGQNWQATNSNIQAPQAGATSYVFGWTGANNPQSYVNNPSNANGALSQYTNKVVPHDLVQITITNTNTSHLSQTVYAQADSDGQWETGQSVLINNKSFISIPLTLAPGSYTATFTEFTPVTTSYYQESPNYTQMGPASSQLSFTVSGTAPSANVPSIAVNTANTDLWMLYDTGFGRLPDQNGFSWWVANTGGSVNNATAQYFLNSPEGQALYGGTTNEQFLDLMYAHCLDRAPDATGEAFWSAQLKDGMSRSDALWYFSTSPEHITTNSFFISNGYWTTPNASSSSTSISSALLA